MKELNTYINDELNISVEAKSLCREEHHEIAKTAELLAEVTRKGKKVLYFGNGGSVR